VSVEDEIYHAARVAAARQRTSVSAFVREALSGLAGKPGRQPLAEQAEKEQRLRLVELLEQCHLDLTERPTREATYAHRRFH
jgi:predicted metalloprotease with PDZ domain